MNNIVIIGDSLAFNRPDILNDNQRWPALLLKKLPDYKINNLSMGSSTSSRFKKLAPSLQVNNDIMIVQIGIVDCAPRLFTKFENRVISRLPSFISKKVISFFKTKRIQCSNRAYVSPESFEKNLLSLFNKYKEMSIFYLKILPASKKFIFSNPTVAKAIDQYNSIIDVCAKFSPNVHLIDFNRYNIDDYTLEDGYHLNAEGHLLTTDLIILSMAEIAK